jgi:hypothetical protein
MKPKFRSAGPPLLTGLVRRMQAWMPYLVMAGQGGEGVRVGRSFFHQTVENARARSKMSGLQMVRQGSWGVGGDSANYNSTEAPRSDLHKIGTRYQYHGHTSSMVTTVSSVRRKARTNRTRMDRKEFSFRFLPVVSVQGCGLDGCIVASLPVSKAALSQIRTVLWNRTELLGVPVPTLEKFRFRFQL